MKILPKKLGSFFYLFFKNLYNKLVYYYYKEKRNGTKIKPNL